MEAFPQWKPILTLQNQFKEIILKKLSLMPFQWTRLTDTIKDSNKDKAPSLSWSYFEELETSASIPCGFQINLQGLWLSTMRSIIHSQSMRQWGKAKSWGKTPLALKNLILFVILHIFSQNVSYENNLSCKTFSETEVGFVPTEL